MALGGRDPNITTGWRPTSRTEETLAAWQVAMWGSRASEGGRCSLRASRDPETFHFFKCPPDPLIFLPALQKIIPK